MGYQAQVLLLGLLLANRHFHAYLFILSELLVDFSQGRNLLASGSSREIYFEKQIFKKLFCFNEQSQIPRAPVFTCRLELSQSILTTEMSIPVPGEQTYFECLISRHSLSNYFSSKSNWLIEMKVRRMSHCCCHINNKYMHMCLYTHILFMYICIYTSISPYSTTGSLC